MVATGTYLDHVEPDGDGLDFEAGFISTSVPLTERAGPCTLGVSAASHVAVTERTYPGWTCGCVKPVRHVMTPAGIAILPKSGDGEAVPCPTWRRTIHTWRRPERVWPGQARPAPSVPAVPANPAGPVDGPRPLVPDDIPKGWRGKRLLPHAGVAAGARGRMVDDGPVVTQLYLAGTTDDDRRWRAVWTDGGFEAARLDGSAVTLTELLAAVLDPTRSNSSEEERP
jgi:hypothetical protein